MTLDAKFDFNFIAKNLYFPMSKLRLMCFLLKLVFLTLLLCMNRIASESTTESSLVQEASSRKNDFHSNALEFQNESCKRKLRMFRGCVNLIVKKWKGNGSNEICCRLISFQKCRSSVFSSSSSSLQSNRCTFSTGMDLSAFDPMFMETLRQPMLMDNMIKRHCEGHDCVTHAYYSLLTTLLIFFACIVIFALISLLIMSRFQN